jgi:predicted RecB family nuclease
VDRTPRPVTGTNLFQRERCPRAVWLEFHGDPSKKLPPDAATQAVMALGREHEETIVSRLEAVEPKYPPRDFEAGARATQALMRDGVPWIYQGVMTAPGKVGKPDLLRRVEGRYVVGDVKLSSSPKVEHAMQVAFYADLLARTTGERGSRAFLILGDGRETEIELAEVEALYQAALADVESLRAGEREPEPFLGPYCPGCGWRGVCRPQMESRGDLSLVFGVTRARRDALGAAGIRSIADLVACDPASVAERTELPRETLRRLRFQACALAEGRPLRLGPLPWRPARIAVTAAIARDRMGSHFATFVAYRTTRVADALEERWIREEATDASSEAGAYRRFLGALAEDLDAPIHHFGSSVPDALSELDVRHGRRGDPIAQVFSRLADVQSGIRSALVLPISSYDLASVAGSLGVPLPLPGPRPSAETELRRVAEEVLAIRRIRAAASRAWRG